MDNLILSSLGHTWIFDIDGTLVKHNGYLLDGHDTLLAGVKEFFEENIRDCDTVILLTSRKEQYIGSTKDFLLNNGIHFDYLLSDIPFGERILINDKKLSGLETAKAINIERDNFTIGKVLVNEKL